MTIRPILQLINCSRPSSATFLSPSKNKFYNKLMRTMSIQYLAPWFKLTTFWLRVFSFDHYIRAPALTRVLTYQVLIVILHLKKPTLNNEKNREFLDRSRMVLIHAFLVSTGLRRFQVSTPWTRRLPLNVRLRPLPRVPAPTPSRPTPLRLSPTTPGRVDDSTKSWRAQKNRRCCKGEITLFNFLVTKVTFSPISQLTDCHIYFSPASRLENKSPFCFCWFFVITTLIDSFPLENHSPKTSSFDQKVNPWNSKSWSSPFIFQNQNPILEIPVPYSSPFIFLLFLSQSLNPELAS